MMQEDPRILELREMRAKARQGGGRQRIESQHARGKLTARERLELLVDPGTFNELEPFITHQGDELGLSGEKYLGEGVVTGYGQIEGRTVYVYAQDFTVFGGTLSEMHSRKICRVMDLAVRAASAPRPSRRTSGEAGLPAASAIKIIYAPLPGIIEAIAVQAGDRVDAGQELCVLEAMKMKNVIRSSRSGEIARLHVSVGQHVKHNDALVEFVA